MNKEQKKLFFKCVFSLVVLSVLIGVVLPMLISAKSTEAVIAGIVVVFSATIYGVFKFINYVLNLMKGELL